MEPVTGSRFDRMYLHLDALRSALKPLQELSAADGSALPARIVAQQLTLAITELRAIDNQIRLDTDAATDATRVACSFCGRPMMPTATLCGFCWRRRSEPNTVAPAVQK